MRTQPNAVAVALLVAELVRGRLEEDEYREDPNEVAPCLVCGEPKPNAARCPCLDGDA